MGLDEDKRDTSWDTVDEVSTLSRLTERHREMARMLRAKVPEYDVVATSAIDPLAGYYSKEPNLKLIVSERMALPLY